MRIISYLKYKTVYCLLFIILFGFANIANAQCYFTLTGDTTANKSCKYALENVVWTNLNGTAAAQNDIIKPGGSNAWDADAISANLVYNNGFMQTIVVETNTNRMIGLNTVNSSANYNDLEYAFYLVSGGNLLIYENGTNMGNWGVYSAGDTLRIAVMDNVVFYIQNENIIYTSTVTPTLPMFVDMSINTVNGTLQDVVVGNGTETLFTVYEANPGSSPTYQWKLNGGNVGSGTTTYTNNLSDGDQLECVLTPSLGGCSGSSVVSNLINIKTIPIQQDISYYIQNDSVQDGSCIYLNEDVLWESLSGGASINGTNNISKSNGTNSWSAGGFSLNKIENGGYVQTIVNETNTNRMIGLNASNTSVNYNEIDYAFYLVSGGGLNIYENGANIGNWGSYTTGDTLRVAVVANEVRYIQNGNVVYTSLVAPSLPLYVDMSLNTVGSTLESITVSNPAYGRFSATINGLANVNYQWKLNGTNVGSNSSIYTNTSITSNDSIVCEFYVDGTQDCGTDTSFYSNIIVVEDHTPSKNVIFSIRNDSVITPSCKYAFEEVSWQSISGLTITSGTNNVEKTSGTNAWNAGGFSYNKVEDGGFMQTIVNETNTNRMIGLNATNTSVNYNEIDYAFYLVSGGNLSIYENGSNMGTWGSYSSGDTLKIAVVDNEVRYIQNGNVVYTSLVVPTLPLYVDMSLHTVGSTLEDIYVNNTSYGVYTAFVSGTSDIQYQWKLNGGNVGTDSPIYTNTSTSNGDVITCELTLTNTIGCSADTILYSNNIEINEQSLTENVLFSIRNDSITNPSCKYAYEEVSWQSISGLTITSGTNNVEKTSGTNAWNAGGFSYNKVEDGGFMQTIVNETNTNRMIGLNATNTSVNYNEIDYAFYLISGGNLSIYENGSNMGTWGSYSSGDTLKIAVVDNEVRYIQNGNVVYTSMVVPTLPLYVDMSLHTVGSTLEEIYVNNTSYGIYTAFVSGASDVSYQWKLNGGNVGADSPSYTNTSTVNGDIISCELTLNNTYGCSDTVLTSNNILINEQSLTTNVLFSIRNDSIVEQSCLYANEEVAWQSISGLTLTSGTNNVEKTSGTNAWNTGGFSYNKVENGGFMQTIVNETNTNRMIGLNATNTSVNYNEIDYAFYLVSGGNLAIYENGSNMGTWGTYATGDTLRLAIINNEIKYMQNGNVVYTSLVAPSTPLYVDMSLHTVGATLKNITVYNGLYGKFTAFVSGANTVSYQWKLNGGNVGSDSPSYTNTSLTDGDIITCELGIIGTTGCNGDTTVISNTIYIEEEPFDDFVTFYITKEATERNGCQFAIEDVAWEAISGVEKNGNSISKTGGVNGWNAGAFSFNQINSNGYMQFIASETNTNRMLGLNSSNVSFNYNDIDYAFYLVSGGNLLVYENGTNRGSVGSYSTNDTLRINVSGNTVEYLKNNALIYTSSVAPSPPLYVDASINTVGGTLNNVQIASATHGTFVANGSNLGSTPSYQWKLNGVNVGADAATYSNDTLKQNDVVTCVVTADYQNCSTTDITSNAITITDQPPLNFIPNFTPTTTTWLGNSTVWHDPTNWSAGIPRSGYSAVVPTGLGSYPVVPNNAYVYAIDVASGASLTLNASAHLSIYDEWSNAGSFTTNTALIEFKTCVDTSKWNSTTPITLYDMKVNNEKGLLISNGIMTVSDSVIFADGIIYNDTNELVFADNAYWKWASDTSYVAGEVQKTGNDLFTFPVGDDNNYQPASITAPSVITDHFTARYYQADPNPTYDETQKDNSIHHISNCEYWIIDRTNGTSSPRVTLSWDVNSCGVTNLSELLVVRWNGVKWKDHGNGGTTGNTTAGTIITSTPVSSFSPFTLASTTNANPLPIELTVFSATPNGQQVNLTWITESEVNNDYFSIERSNDALNWEELERVNGAGNSNISLEYKAIDEFPLKGVSYYRLKQTDYNGDFSYSDVKTVRFNHSDIVIYPNPVKELLTIKHLCDECTINVYAATGQIVYSGNATHINASEWNKGLYEVIVINDNGVVYSTRIIK